MAACLTKPLAHRADRGPRGDSRHPADHHRDCHRGRHPRHHRTPDALAARSRPAPRPGRHPAIAVLCMIIDLTMITIHTLSGALPGPLVIIAFAASLTRIVCSITTVRHASLMRV